MFHFNTLEHTSRRLRNARAAISMFAIVAALAPRAANADNSSLAGHVMTCQQIEKMCERWGARMSSLGYSGPPMNLSLPDDCQRYMDKAVQAGGVWLSGGLSTPSPLPPTVILCTN